MRWQWWAMGQQSGAGFGHPGDAYNLTADQQRFRRPAALPTPMKFQPDHSNPQTITASGPGWSRTGADKISPSVLIGASGLRQACPCARFEDLGAGHFAQLAGLDAELIIFGSGTRNRFPAPAWLAPLMARRMGLETMDTPAACRTYNLLAHEGRKVVAALIL